jgi:hypothetical protein
MMSQKTPKKVTTTKTQILGTITKHAYTVIPTVVTKTKTLTCSIPKRQPYHDPWARITPTVVYAAALETASLTTSVAATTTGTHRRRDAKRHVAADNRAEFLAAREARLADAQVIQKRGLDNGTVTLTELDTSKWATSTSMSTAPATTTWLTQDVDTSITTTSTETFWSGVTKVVITVTAVRHSLIFACDFHLLTSSCSPRPPRRRPSTRSSRQQLRPQDAQRSQSRSRQHLQPARLFARRRAASSYERLVVARWHCCSKLISIAFCGTRALRSRTSAYAGGGLG